MLKPLGTIIIQSCPPSMTNTDLRYSIIKYRVVDYKKFQKNLAGDWEWGEELEVLSIEHKMPKSFTWEIQNIPTVVEVCNYI